VPLQSDLEQIVYFRAASLRPLDFVAVQGSARCNLVFRKRCTASSIRVEASYWMALSFPCGGCGKESSDCKTVISFAFHFEPYNYPEIIHSLSCKMLGPGATGLTPR
jgi:hypothetical protein